MQKLEHFDYRPEVLLDNLLAHLDLRNDAELSRKLVVGPSVISKVRNRRAPLSSELLLRMHEISELSVKELRVLMGDRDIAAVYKPFPVSTSRATSKTSETNQSEKTWT